MPPITQVNLSKRIRIGEHCHILSRREPEKCRHWHHRRTSLFVQRGNYLSITANVYFCLECNVGFGVSWFIVVKVKPFWSKSPVYWLVIMVFSCAFHTASTKKWTKYLKSNCSWWEIIHERMNPLCCSTLPGRQRYFDKHIASHFFFTLFSDCYCKVSYRIGFHHFRNNPFELVLCVFLKMYGLFKGYYRDGNNSSSTKY